MLRLAGAAEVLNTFWLFLLENNGKKYMKESEGLLF